MKYYTAYRLLSFSLLITLVACDKEAITTYHANALKTDDRYSTEISFNTIGVKIPIQSKDTYIRIDDPVDNVESHQKELFQELRVTTTNWVYTNPAINGRQVLLQFKDGKKCSFIWTLKDPDDRITIIRTEHEKYHALVRLAPEGVQVLSEAIRQKGFYLDLERYDEELSATIIEILSLHLMGVPFNQFDGSTEVMKAKEILQQSMSNQRVDPNVKTPIESGKVQGTAGHP